MTLQRMVVRIELAPRHSPQCEGTVNDQTQRWRERNHRDNRCDRVARFTVLGKNYCALHGGEAALAFLIRTEVIVD